ncbi:hypothetical protein ACWJJH_11155 [Endozoicomonadaceae bacterium StTr2]
MESTLVEYVGYAASVMVAISLSMKDVKWLRILNFIGCSLFVAYGIWIGAMPVIAANLYIACINVYYLAKMYRTSPKPATA